MDNLPGKENNCLILKKKNQYVLKLLRLSVYMVMKSNVCEPEHAIRTDLQSSL